MTKMSKILWEGGHALSTDPTFPRAYVASILNPLHYKFLATPLVIDELKCHKLCSKYPPFSLTQVWIRMSHPRHSVAVTLSPVSGERT